jgi:hypothetical protein
MSKFLRFLSVILFAALLFVSDSMGQSINNGTIGVTLSTYGRVRVTGIDADALQIDRSSILVGHTADQVFDYWNDAENVDTARTVTNPQLSDLEAYVSIDNAYSGLPPAALVKINAYGWNSTGYVIVKFNVQNMEDSNWANTLIGMELIPQIDGVYGFETHEWVVGSDVLDMYSGASTHIGYKVLSSTFRSIRTIDWYDGYNDFDTDLWSWLSYADYDTLYECPSADGTVGFFSQQPVDIAAGDSTEVFVGIAIGSNQTQMLENMAAAATKYTEVFTPNSITDTEVAPQQFELAQNYPNPFNPTTAIRFTLPVAEQAQLTVFNMLGQNVATLVNDHLAAGSYEFEFDAASLPSGVYFYSLQAGNFSMTKKMILLK